MSFDDTVTIAVDAMGGDHAPGVVLEGVASALEKDEKLQVILVGPAEVVEPFASSHARCVAQPATEVIAMDEHPAQAVRKKKDSSIVVGCRAVKEGRAQGFFSAGSTGACLAGATLGIGRIKGVQRPALCSVIPSPVAPVVMTDIGANADCKPEYLVQFARMAAIYAEKIVGIESPRIALLNIGEEDTKGSQFAQQTFELMKEGVPGFVGNAEGNDIINARYDVIVTDGFTGNVTLKTIEGTSKALFSALKEVMTSSLKAKVGGLALKKDLKELKDSINADTYGGAPLLGVAGVCLVGHGSSNATAIMNGVLASAEMVRKDVAGLISEAVGK
ncbi:phosphate acyltransferase PlsX [Slackia faecicanis]|uniref:Phosphate acyltransferase n=1 Tax=Slackia faecicanis TaxID=255723 RepID=A0A3N0AIG7_9ACTN|nr:phosphate acyltransferase PlsX [Slackia faecicanis]RNL21591.1 phosphate acyltransferase PlsX [Slackia faecicanis]